MTTATIRKNTRKKTATTSPKASSHELLDALIAEIRRQPEEQAKELMGAFADAVMARDGDMKQRVINRLFELPGVPSPSFREQIREAEARIANSSQ